MTWSSFRPGRHRFDGPNDGVEIIDIHASNAFSYVVALSEATLLARTVEKPPRPRVYGALQTGRIQAGRRP